MAMPNTGAAAPWPMLSMVLTALLRVARALLVLVLLITTMLLALTLATGLVLRALFTRHRRAVPYSGAPGTVRPSAYRAPTRRNCIAPGEVVDVEAHEVIAPEKNGP